MENIAKIVTVFLFKKEKAVKPLFLLFKVFFCVEARHIAELKEVPAVTVINVFLDILVVDLTCSDVAIEHRVGKAEVVLKRREVRRVCLSASFHQL